MKRTLMACGVMLAAVSVVLAVAISSCGSKAKANDVPRYDSGEPAPSAIATVAAFPASAEHTLMQEKWNYDAGPLKHEKGVFIDGGFKNLADKKSGETTESVYYGNKVRLAQAAAQDGYVLERALRVMGITNVDGEKLPAASTLMKDRDARIKWHLILLPELQSTKFQEVNLQGRTLMNEGVSGGNTTTVQQTNFSQATPGTEMTTPSGKKCTCKNECVNFQFVSEREVPGKVKVLAPCNPETPGPARQPTTPKAGPTPGYTPHSHEDQSNSPQGTNHSGSGESGTGNPPPGQDTETGETGTDAGVSNPTPTPADPGPAPGDAPPVSGTSPPPSSD